MAVVYRIAVWWMSVFAALAMVLLIASAIGMAFVSGATPNPEQYPARFIVLALVAISLALPGWILSIVLMFKVRP